jgi:hypothetical protein
MSEGRVCHDVAVFDNCISVMEGPVSRCANSNEGWHSADGIHWTEIPDTPWSPRHAASVFVYDNALDVPRTPTSRIIP